MKNIFGILTLVLIAGCSGPQVFVNRNPLKDTPSFTVIPAAYGIEEINFAAKVELGIARTYLKVIERPAFKFMDTDETRTDSESSSTAVYGGHAHAEGTSISRPVKITDTVAMYQNTKADYIVNTYWSSRRVRIIKNDDGTLISTLLLPSDDSNAIGNTMYTALTAAGFLKDGYDEARCTIETRSR